MKAGKYKIKELLVNREVEQIVIPEIQRDYVWGEEQVIGLLNSLYSDFLNYNDAVVEVSADNSEIENLFKQFYKQQKYSSSIGFIYAYNDPEYKGKFYLIDGQQRLTTVYLVLLALSSMLKDDKLDTFRKRYFFEKQLKIDYKVRESAHDFLCHFINFCLSQNYQDKNSFKINLEYQAWFFSGYENDKTIQSIIRNYIIIREFIQQNSLDTITFYDYFENVECWYFDTNKSEQGEELYIYMNARGEQIQNNENIKADLLGALTEKDILIVSAKHDYSEEISVVGLKKYWGKKWEEWQDFFWKNRGENENADNGFNEFLKCIAGLEVYLIKILEPSYQHKNIFEQLTLLKIEDYYLNLKWLFDEKNIAKFKSQYSYSKWIGKSVSEIWQIFNKNKIDWFIDYGDDKQAKILNTMAFIWPIFYYLKLNSKSLETDNAYRVLRLFYLRLNNNIRAVKSINDLVHRITNSGVWDERSGIINGITMNQSDNSEEEAKNAKTFLKEENIKHQFLNNLEEDKKKLFEQAIWEIEDHPLNLSGKNLKNQNISHLVDFEQLSNSINSLNILININIKFNAVFPLNKEESINANELKPLQSLLLHYGTHMHKVGANYLCNYEFDNWGRIIRNIDGRAFQLFFEDYKTRTISIPELLSEKELLFCENKKQKTIESETEFKDQIIIYSIILKEKTWIYGGNLGYRDWEAEDTLFPNQYRIYNFDKSFISRKGLLWDLIPADIQETLDKTTIISELKKIIS